ncbi:MAG: DUF1244 domain-containing protein [Phyllobacteriaceae bacterium]|nr:DUF1244 domain-containing protein [Phyllobacteriaceae bacterium]
MASYVGGREKAMDKTQQTELEAAAFRRLVEHLRKRADVQNIDMMNLAGFCRNCLSNWMEDAAREQGVALTRDEARRHIYGMSYEDWKARHQTQASEAQKQAFEINKPKSPESH